MHPTLESAKTLVNNRQYAEARVELESLARSADAPPEVFALLARALHRTHGSEASLAALAAGRQRQGDQLPLQLAEATLQYESGATEEAIAALQRICRDNPQRLNARTILAGWLAKARRHDEVFELLDGRSGRRNAPATLRMWMSAGLRAGRFSGNEKELAAIRKGAAGDESRLQLAWLAVFSAAGGGGTPPTLSTPLSAEALRDCRQYLLALAGSTTADAVRIFMQHLRAFDPGMDEFAETTLLALFNAPDVTVERQEILALSAAVEVHERRAKDFTDVLSIYKAPPECNDALVRAAERITDPAFRALRSLDIVEFLISLGDAGRARALLRSVSVSSLNRSGRLRVRSLSALLGEPEPAGLDVNGIIEPDAVYEDGLVRHFRFGKERCVIWFDSVLATREANRQQQWLAIWKKHGVSVLAVQDPLRLASMGGFGRHFGNRPAAEEALKLILANHDYKQLLTSGASLGGSSALLYGIRMQATGFLLYAGMTHLPPVDELSAAFGLLILHRMRHSMNIEFDDIVTLLEAHPNPGMVIHQHYGTGNAIDNEQARHIAHLPGVRLFPGDHGRHDVQGWLLEQGLLEDAIAGFVADLPPPGGAD